MAVVSITAAKEEVRSSMKGKKSVWGGGQVTYLT